MGKIGPTKKRGKIWEKYDQNMDHKMGKIWARFGPISEKVLRVLVVYGICDK